MTNKAKHTPELSIGGHLTVYHSDREGGMRTWSISDAQRLVACWNACAGIPTEQLEKAYFRGLVISLKRMLATHSMENIGVDASRHRLQAKKAAREAPPFQKEPNQ